MPNQHMTSIIRSSQLELGLLTSTGGVVGPGGGSAVVTETVVVTYVAVVVAVVVATRVRVVVVMIGSLPLPGPPGLVLSLC